MVTKKSCGLSPRRSTSINISEVFVGSGYLTSPKTDLWKLYPKVTCIKISNGGQWDRSTKLHWMLFGAGLTQGYCDPSGLLINLYPITKPVSKLCLYLKSKTFDLCLKTILIAPGEMKQLIYEEEIMTYLNQKVPADPSVGPKFRLDFYSFYFFLFLVHVFNQIYNVFDMTAPPCGHFVLLPSWFNAHDRKKNGTSGSKKISFNLLLPVFVLCVWFSFECYTTVTLYSTALLWFLLC